MTMPAKKAPSAKGDAEQFGGAEGDADGRRNDGQGEQFPRTGAGHLPEQPGNDLAADDQHQGDEGADFEQGLGDGHPDRAIASAAPALPPSMPASGGSMTSTSTVARSSTTSQPTAMRPFIAVEHAVRLQRLEQHHGAGAGQRQAEEQAMPPFPSPPPAHRHAEHGGDAHLDHGAGYGNALDGKQVTDGKMQADAEHQQHDADFGKLRGDPHVGDEAGGRRPDQDAGDQVADQRRQLQALGDQAEHQRNAEAGGQGRD
jgi:hypothetical protein